jgi:hypothetical protein
MLYFSAGIGYLVNITNNFYFDSRFSLSASLSVPAEVDVGGYEFLPGKAAYGNPVISSP